MSANPSVSRRSLATAIILFIAFIPSLVSAASTSPSHRPQFGDVSRHTPAVCPAQPTADTAPSSGVGTRKNPTPLGNVITVKNASSEYKIGISEDVRGTAAWKRIQKYDAQNTPPADGKE